MFDKLPNFIDPINFVNHHKQIKARVNQSAFPRLKAQLAEREEERQVKVEMSFYYDKTLKFPAFEMKLETTLSLICQRSLQPFDLPVSSQVKGVFAESMALAEELPEEIEVYELTEDRISLYDLVEDELLLSIPLSPIDETAALGWEDVPLEEVAEAAASESVQEIEEEQKRENPFAALEALKSKK